VGELSSEWRKVDTKSDLSFRSERGGTIYANVECDKTDDAPLDVLTNHLLFGVDIKDERRKEITLAGRKALRTRVDGEVDGVPVSLDTVVMLKDGCTYDLALVAGPEQFSQLEADFDRFVEGFETIENRKVRDPEGEEKEEWACSVVPC
jgi:hypothetical protein